MKWLKDEGIRPKIIIKILKRYPDGIAAKYLEGKQDRVATEAKRVYGKPDAPKDDSKAKDNKDDANTKDAKAKGRLILSSEEFTRGFVPPDYLWDGILLRGYVYSLTARTGEGKTAIMLALSASIALGKDFSGREVAQGKVLYFAGENPNDVCMRWIAMAEHKDFDADFIGVHFISGTFDIGELEQKIRDEVDALGGVTFVVIDTSPAYFQGDNENDAVQMIAHAEMLRRLESLSGRPTILAATHPVKNASNDNLVPRGGGSFLNAMDGNLSCFKVDMLVTMHHQGKFRGVDFEPMTFELEPVIARKLINSKGRHIPTVIARDLSKDDQREKNREARSDEDAILVLLFRRTKSTSLNEIASELGWFVGSDNHPNKSKVQRLINDLKRGNKADRLVEVDRDGAKLTKKGSTSAAAAAGTAAAAAAAAAMEAATSPEQGTKPML